MSELQEQSRQFRAANGINISYKISRCLDASHTLVLLHGLASNHTRWSEFIDHTQLTGLANLLRLDLRGHAGSMTRGQIIDHKIWMQDLRGILEKEALNNIILVGHSMGAQLAMHYAIAHTQDVAGLVLIDPTLPRELKGKLAAARRLRYTLYAGILLLILLYRLVPLHRKYPVCDLRALDIKTRDLMTQYSPDVIARLYTSPRTDLQYLPLTNYLQDLYATISPLPDVSRIQCPVKVLLSRSSSIVNPSNVRNYFSPVIDLDVSVIDANHWPLTEKPDETRHAIDEWCQKLITSWQK